MTVNAINMKISDLDVEILTCLYKCEYMHDYHIAALVGENKEYIKGRLKQLCEAGLLRRKMLKSNYPAVNWLTKKGIQVLDFSMRNVREPTLGRYEHTIGCVDSYVFLTLMRRRKDGSYGRLVSFGEIITERDFNAVRELKQVASKKNGQPVYVSMDLGMHKPDGYFKHGDKYCAIEYERTSKSSVKDIKNNILSNAKRFEVQYWTYAKNSIYKVLLKEQEKYGKNRLIILDIEAIRFEISRYVAALPREISKKTCKPRVSAVGELIEPIPLNRLPIRSEAQALPKLETRLPEKDASSYESKKTDSDLTEKKKLSFERR